MAHKHAELMRLYAEDAAKHDEPWLLWEFRHSTEGIWIPCSCGPLWGLCTEYRHKPRTININGFEIPEPVIKEPEVGQIYYVVSIHLTETGLCYGLKWSGLEREKRALRIGICHTTREAAEKHAEALLSFTRVYRGR